MQKEADEVCLLLRRIFTVFTNLSETTIWISQKLRRVNSIKLLFMPFFSVRVFFFAERPKIDAYVTKFAGYL